MASTGTATNLSVADCCSNFVNDHFQKKPFEGFRLDDFDASKQKGLLAGLLKSNVPQYPPNKRDPDAVPAFLLYDLSQKQGEPQEEKHKDTEAYKFIESTEDICSGLYGTSGAGKTRRIYEYLSHNFGFYFVARTTNDPGSGDLKELVHLFDRYHAGNALTKSLSHFDSQAEDYEAKLKEIRLDESSKNLIRMERYVSIVVYIRMLVFDAVNRQLSIHEKPVLTAYDWLLLQLFPREAFEVDLFKKATVKALSLANNLREDESALQKITEVMEEQTIKFSMVVDEAQVLLDQLPGFFLGRKGKIKRTAFSGVIQGLASIADYNEPPHGSPLVAGTGMSMDEIKEASDSIMAKRPIQLQQNRRKIFYEFWPLNPKDVREYLLQFLNLDVSKTAPEGEVSNSCVIDHVSKWLRGRPRWAASFLELYLVRKTNEDHNGTRGSFSPEGALLIQALDRYIDNYTTAELPDLGSEAGAKSDKRKSIEPKEGSAYSGIKEVVEEPGGYALAKTVESAIFKYAVGGKAVFVDEHHKKLIEVGVAALSHSEGGAVFDEPIVIQAGINYFSLREMVIGNMTAQEEGGLGEGFEKVILPGIQTQLPKTLQEQLEGFLGWEVLKPLLVPERSAYGMLAFQCKNAADTIRWINDATKSTFEGQVVPFCYPDVNIGPDLIFLMWDCDYKKYIPVISQAKYRKNFNQMDALRTITPSLLYHENRGTADVTLSRVIASDDGLKKSWEEIKPKLVGEKHGCMRLMVQYPANGAGSATPGVLEDDSEKVVVPIDMNPVDRSGKRQSKRVEANAKKRKVGWLATISKENAPELFAHRDLMVLNALKGKGGGD